MAKFDAYNNQDGKPQAGWQVIHENDYVLIVNANELPMKGQRAKSSSFIQFDAQEKRWEIKSEAKNLLQIKTEAIDVDKPASGTVIITSGNAGVYKQHKSETMFFLLRNMNVTLFNCRGYGENEGEPTTRKSYLDIEAAYYKSLIFKMVLRNINHRDCRLGFRFSSQFPMSW